MSPIACAHERLAKSSRQAGLSVLGLMPGGEQCEQVVAEELRGLAHLLVCKSVPTLLEALESRQGSIVLLELGTSEPGAAAQTIALIKSRYPSIPILGLCWLTRAAVRDVVTCAHAGLDGVAIRGFDHIGELVARHHNPLHDAIQCAAADLSPVLPAAVARWIPLLLAHANKAPNVFVLSRLLGCSPRSLQRTARRSGCHKPAAIIDAARVLHAARLIAVHGMLPREALHPTGYPTVEALRRAFKRVDLPCPTGLRSVATYDAARDQVRRFVGRLTGIADVDAGTTCKQDAWTDTRTPDDLTLGAEYSGGVTPSNSSR
jgi:AraC-like DNA-binding protein